MTFIIGRPKVAKFRNPIEEIHSRYKCSKVWLGDALMCSCVFPHLRMSEGWFGFTCVNTRCRDFITKRDAKFCERVKLDTASVNRFLTRRHSSSLMRQIAKAEKTGVYIQAYGE